MSIMREVHEEHATQQNIGGVEVRERKDHKLAAGATVLAKATRVEKVASDAYSATNNDVVSNGSD